MTLQITMDWLGGGCHAPSLFPAHNLGSTDPNVVHPACTNLRLLWDAGMVAMIPCTGPDDANGSHFNMIRGQQDRANNAEVLSGIGWANYALSQMFPEASDVLGIAVGDSLLPRILQGPAPAAAVHRNVTGVDNDQFAALIDDAASADDIDPFLRDQFIFQTEIALRVAGYNLSHGSRGRTLAEAFAENPSILFGFTEFGGFDTHTKHKEQLATSLSIWDASLGELARARGWLSRPTGDGPQDDLPKIDSDALHLVGTDFSRDLILTSGEGYSHGRGGFILVIGPRVTGGFHGPAMPTLAHPERVLHGRFLPVDVPSASVWLSVLREAGWATKGVFLKDYEYFAGLFKSSVQQPDPRPEPEPEPEPAIGESQRIAAQMRALADRVEALQI